ncbi:MAG: DUF4382 domain-containing protein [Gammaproteobacteria bacterium]|nr:DUF4382 domain-containing protein [Gammaproteobacteria bacterium]
MTRRLNFAYLLSLVLMVSACGTDTGSGDRGSSTSSQQTRGVTITTSSGIMPEDSRFSLRLTDAPIDNLSRVMVRFTAVEMKRKQGGWSRYTFDTPQDIDLLALQGMTTADLLVEMPIEPGNYKQVRFLVDETPMANWVEHKSGGTHNLEIPDGGSKGLKVGQNFTIPQDRLINFTVDFDLRKAVKYKKGSGTYRLKSKMRLVVDENVGVIRGTVGSSWLLGAGCSDANVDTHNAVYVFAGHNVVPDDIDESSNTDVEPLTTTPISYDAASGLYLYEAAFLPQGNYTVAFTCNSDLDDTDTDDILPFFYTQNVNVLVTDTTFLKP